ncbi:MAG: helix-hairpin-helix domain-containing protein [Phycisphaerales bacterium]
MGGDTKSVTAGVVAGPVKWAGVGALVTLAIGATVMAFYSRTPDPITPNSPVSSDVASTILVASSTSSTQTSAPTTPVAPDRVMPPVAITPAVGLASNEPLGPPSPVLPLTAPSGPGPVAPAAHPAGDSPREPSPAAAEPPRVEPSQKPTTSPAPKVTPTKPTVPSSIARLININTASQSELELLPRIGPALAGRIVEYREEHGPFRRPEDLDRVKGIGAKTLERLLPLITTGE